MLTENIIDEGSQILKIIFVTFTLGWTLCDYEIDAIDKGNQVIVTHPLQLLK